MKFPESKLAHKYLDGLSGVEIGGALHNQFGLNTINVDRYDNETVYKAAEKHNLGEAMKVDVVAHGDNLPFPDKSYDFVISSHVIEHFFDPIKAIREWQRVAKEYIFIIAPHKERTFDKDREITSASELVKRHQNNVFYGNEYPDKHWSVWDTQSFKELIEAMNLEIIEYQDVDDKVGNGFAFLIKV